MLYGVYDMKNYEQCIGIFDTLKEVAKFLDRNYTTCAGTFSRNSKIGARYKIVKIEEER